jgi:Mrp family chromosome partitioning ATPase
VRPAIGAAGVRVMSMDLLLESDEAPVRWTGPRSESWIWRATVEANALREFLADTDWGALDHLILDLPPGADRMLPIRDLVPGLAGVVAVTVPSRISRFVVAKSLTMARELELPILGYVLNMAGYVCPDCGEVGPLFGGAAEGFEGIDRLGTIPFDPEFGRETDAGRPGVLACPYSAAARAVREIAAAVRGRLEGGA